MEKSWIIAMITIGAFVSVDCLQCYICYDCVASALKDEHLVTCNATTSSTTTPTTTTTTTTLAPVNPGTNGTDPVVNGTNPVVNGTNPVVNGTNPIVNGTYSDDLKVLRVRRNVLPESEMERRCSCYGEDCSCDVEGALLKAFQYADVVTYVCAKGTVKGTNNTDVIIRGCEPETIDGKALCTYLAESNVTNCHTCNKDKCNGADAMQHSIVVQLLFVLTSLVAINKCP